MPSRRPAAALALPVLVAGTAFAWWEGTNGRNSAASHWSVGSSIVLVVVASVVAGRGRQTQPSSAWARGGLDGVRHWRDAAPPTVVSTIGWALLLTALVGWGLASFVAQTHGLPTFSSLVGTITRRHWGRSVVFAAWLALGATLATWNRTPRR
jgi:hypothetical protein